MGYTLLSHELLTGCGQLFTIALRQAVAAHTAIDDHVITAGQQMVVTFLCSLLCSLSR